MKKFSERIGIEDSTPSIQTESMNAALRNSLWNFILDQYKDKWFQAARFIARFFRKVPTDELPFDHHDCKEWVKRYFYKLEWFNVYNFIEFLVQNNDHITNHPRYHTEKLIDFYNIIFQTELSGYRFISGVLAPISNPAETTAIAGAIEATSRTGLHGAHVHLETALKQLGKKPEPDYRNAIKEAISAVESISMQLSGNDSQGLAGALNALEEKMQIHGSLKSAFIKLYGYSSNEDGIRHAILDEPNVGFDEAKYMIVACSAFVNYLISKASSTGLL